MSPSLNTSIEWTEATWNPVRGCSRVSEGCRNCYAERLATRFNGPGKPYEGLVRMVNGHPQWTGKVAFVEEHLADPLKWKTPRRIFVNSMSDLFHESLSEGQIMDIWHVMESCPWHTFQVLTKRPKRMLEWVSKFADCSLYAPILPNVWLGVSCEDQKTAGERIPLLLQAPAAVRWISAEPLLGPIDFSRIVMRDGDHLDTLYNDGEDAGLDWVVAGSESGPGARPADLQWFRDIRDRCAAADVPFFLKQFARNGRKLPTPQLDGVQWMQYPKERR